MEKILVTGGAGYIGTILVPELLRLGHKVTIYDNFMFGAQTLLGFSAHPNLSIVQGDVRDADKVKEVVKGQDWIVHLAAIVGYPACAADPVRANSVNVDGTRNIVNAMQKGQKLLYASTGSTYGKVLGIATEETPINPLTLYGRNKRDCEDMIKQTDHDFTLFRFATVFGSSPRMRLDLLINDFTYQAIHNKQIVIFEGHFRRTFLHSMDAAAIYPFAMSHWDEMNGGTYNVGDETMNYTKREAAQEIAKKVEYYLHEADFGTDPDARDYEVDYSKLKSLGYKAKIDLSAGIDELIKIISVLKITNPLRNA
ncbi:NAD(P)-dependent oxidoreductase [bacterium]|nr:NAD(P)-dependent oxidoreductase [bacterium]